MHIVRYLLCGGVAVARVYAVERAALARGAFSCGGWSSADS